MNLPSSSSPPDPLPIRWAVILVTAVVVSLIVAVLTFMQTVSWPATLLASLGAGGTAIPALHHVLGR